MTSDIDGPLLFVTCLPVYSSDIYLNIYFTDLDGEGTLIYGGCVIGSELREWQEGSDYSQSSDDPLLSVWKAVPPKGSLVRTIVTCPIIPITEKFTNFKILTPHVSS